MEPVEKQQLPRPRSQSKEVGEADNPGPALIIEAMHHAATASPRRCSKKRLSAIMKTRSEDARCSLVEKQFNSIRHLIDQDEAAPKTASQWSHRLQNHLKSKFERGPSENMSAYAHKISWTSTRDGVGSSNNVISNKSYDGEDSSQEILFDPQQVDPQTHAEASHSSMSRLRSSKLDNSFTPEEFVGGWFASKRRTSGTEGGASNQSSQNSNSSIKASNNASLNQASVNFFNNTLEMSYREEFQAASNPSTLTSQSPTTPTRKSIFRKAAGKPAMAPKLAKQLIDFRQKRLKSKDSGEAQEDKNNNDEGSDGFSVTTEILSVHSKRVSLTEGELDHVLGTSGGDTDEFNRQMIDNQHKRGGFKQDIVEWRREKYTKQSATTMGGKSLKDATSRRKSKSRMRATALLLSETNHANNGGSIDGEVLLVEQKTLSGKIIATGKMPARSRSGNTKKSLALSLSSSEQSNKNENDDAGTVLDTLFDDDDSDFFQQTESRKGKETITRQDIKMPALATSISSIEKPTRIKRAQTTSAMMESKTLKSTRTTMSMDDKSRSQRNDTQRSERTTTSTGSSMRSQRTTGGSMRNNRTIDLLTNTPTTRSERTTSTRSESQRTAQTVTSSSRSQGTVDAKTKNVKEDGLASVFLKASKKRRPKRRASLSSVDDFENSFQIVDGAFMFGSSGNANLDQPDDFEESFTSEADKNTTKMFHESFTAEALVSPHVQKKSYMTSSMPNVITSQIPNLLDTSFALLSTVDETSKGSQEEKKPKRRNSLPTGSSHGSAVKVRSAVDAQKKSASTRESITFRNKNKKNRRRTSTNTELHASLAGMQGPNLESDSGTIKSGDDQTKDSSTVRKFGIAPSPADTKHTTRRRASTANESVPEAKESKVGQIRLRRRVSQRVGTTGDKLSSRSRTSKTSNRIQTAAAVQTLDAGQSFTILWQRGAPVATSVSEVDRFESMELQKEIKYEACQTLADTGQKARRGRRRSTRETTREGRATGLATFTHLLRRTMTHDGATNTPESALKDEPTKGRQGSLTPNSSRRFHRQSEAAPVTPGRKERLKYRKSIEGEVLTSSMVWQAGLDPALSEEGGERSLHESMRANASVDESSTHSNDSSVTPTPKPTAPPSLPVLSIRESTRRNAGTTLRPRRQKSLEDRTILSMQSSSCADPLNSTSLLSRKNRKRSRRNTAHEALKQDKVFSKGSDKHKITSTSASIAATILMSPAFDTRNIKSISKQQRSILLKELTESPAKTIRPQRSRKGSSQKASKVAKAKTRRSKSDEIDGDTGKERRREDSVGNAMKWSRNPSRRVRRNKTADGVVTTLPMASQMAKSKNSDPKKAVLQGLSF